MVRTRRAGVMTAAAATLLLTIAGCAEKDAAGGGGGDTSGPIRIGAVLDITAPERASAYPSARRWSC